MWFVIESNLFSFSLAMGFPFTGCVPFLVVHSWARFSMMHACMHEQKWTPIRVIGDTANLEII
jgi:hypothetical protein